jgi:hypothetical protein
MPNIALPPTPPAPPSVDANGIITISALLQNPARVRRVVQNLAYQRFIADVIFAGGPQATGGAVLYDQIDTNDLFLSRDVQPIAPGGEFPDLTDVIPVPKLAAVGKWGGRAKITDEQRDRNAYDVLVRELTKLRNTIVRKVDNVAIAALNAAPIQAMTGADWTNTANDPLAQLVAARQLVDEIDMGYEADTVLINPIQEADFLSRSDIRRALNPAPSEDAIIRGGNVGQILSFEILKSNRVPAGTAYVMQRKIVGGISDEVPLNTKTYREEEIESTWIQGSRRLVPYVTDPLACVKITSV